jgi:molecular chaperone GrpE (heat shock protein)
MNKEQATQQLAAAYYAQEDQIKQLQKDCDRYKKSLEEAHEFYSKKPLDGLYKEMIEITSLLPAWYKAEIQAIEDVASRYNKRMNEYSDEIYRLAVLIRMIEKQNA